MADHSINPNDGAVQRTFRTWRETSYGKDNGKEMFDKLDELVLIYNSENKEAGGRACLIQYVSNSSDTTTEQPLVLAIVTPYGTNSRTQTTIQGCICWFNCKFLSFQFTISTASSAGGIPLGI